MPLVILTSLSKFASSHSFIQRVLLRGTLLMLRIQQATSRAVSCQPLWHRERKRKHMSKQDSTCFHQGDSLSKHTAFPKSTSINPCLLIYQKYVLILLRDTLGQLGVFFWGGGERFWNNTWCLSFSECCVITRLALLDLRFSFAEQLCIRKRSRGRRQPRLECRKWKDPTATVLTGCRSMQHYQPIHLFSVSKDAVNKGTCRYFPLFY